VETIRETPAGNAAQELRIRQIELIPLVVPLSRKYQGSYYAMTDRATIVTRVHTEEGVVGEAYAADEEATLPLIQRIIAEEITPRLQGVSALAYERCWELAYPVTYDQLRDKRVGLVAVACVDFAIWDAIGKFLSLPLWRLWGGYRDRLPVNIIGGYYRGDLDDIRQEAEGWNGAGYRGCKFKVGGRTPAEDATRVETARAALGDEFVLTVDANQGYTLEQALEFCARTRDLDIRWFEEPCIWSNDKRDLRDVRARGGIPTCAGQSEFSPQACRDLFELGAIDVCNFDASWSGGYTNWKRMAATAALYSVELAHHEEPQVAAHLLASQPHGTYVEIFDAERDPIWWNLIANRPTLEDGTFALPTEPGFGWQLDDDYIEHHRVDR
jgi:L-alanine-DL-glutamate epimerase-like enolase superfamily enzyme